MYPRDVFDGLFVTILAVVVYLEVIGPGFYVERLQRLVGTILGLDPIVYVVIACMLGLVFVGAMVLARTAQPASEPSGFGGPPYSSRVQNYP